MANEQAIKRNLQIARKQDRTKRDEGKKPSENQKQQPKDMFLAPIYFGVLLLFAVIFDFTSLASGGLATALDWVFDLSFAPAIVLTIFLSTGDIMEAFTGKRFATNLGSGILELIPGIDTGPWHSLAVVLLYLDLKYNVISKISKVAKLPQKIKK